MATPCFLLFLTFAFVYLSACFAADLASSFVVKGRVYCDACAAGHFSKSSSYLPDAVVAVQCTSKKGIQTVHIEGKTDVNGVFQIEVPGDHEQELCVAAILRSTSPTCYLLTQRMVARVQLTSNNGLSTNVINTGPFGFRPKQVAPDCAAELYAESAVESYEPDTYYYSPAPSGPSPVQKPSPSPVYNKPSPKPSPSPYYKPSPVYKPSPSPVKKPSPSPSYKPSPSHSPVYKPSPYPGKPSPSPAQKPSPKPSPSPSPVYNKPSPSPSPIYKPSPSPYNKPSPSSGVKTPPTYPSPSSPPY